MRTKTTHVEDRYQHFAIETAEQNRANLFDKIVTGRPNAYVQISRGIVADIGGTTIWRWLHEDAIKPWTHRSWVFPRDPRFAAKAGAILDLYEGRWRGKPLSDRDFVLCADEKPSIQARRRNHPTGAPVAEQPMRVEHEYVREGACT